MQPLECKQIKIINSFMNVINKSTAKLIKSEQITHSIFTKKIELWYTYVYFCDLQWPFSSYMNNVCLSVNKNGNGL